jgi:uncharacterized phiE125 gp8 family phage protein
MTVRVITAPAYEPVSLAEAKEWCRIESDITDEDALLGALVKAMRRYAENLTHRAFMQRDLQLVLPCWPRVCIHDQEFTAIELPWPPLVAVTEITYMDLDGNTQTLAADQYEVHAWREPALIVPEWEVSWPSTRAALDAVRVSYTAGYAPVGSPDDEAAQQAGVPENLKLWMKARLATLYANREQLAPGNQVAIPRNFADGLLDELIVGTRIA